MPNDFFQGGPTCSPRAGAPGDNAYLLLYRTVTYLRGVKVQNNQHAVMHGHEK